MKGEAPPTERSNAGGGEVGVDENGERRRMVGERGGMAFPHGTLS